MSTTNVDKLKAICREAIDTFSYDNLVKNVISAYLAEKLDEKKVLVMPYNIGDKLYRACSWFDQVDELTVSMITQKKDGTFKIRMTSSIHKSVQDFSLEDIADPKYDIYADRSEAETAHKRAREARFEALKEKVANLNLN